MRTMNSYRIVPTKIKKSTQAQAGLKLQEVGGKGTLYNIMNNIPIIIKKTILMHELWQLGLLDFLGKLATNINMNGSHKQEAGIIHKQLVMN